MYSPYSEYENEADIPVYSLGAIQKKDVSNPFYPPKTEFEDFVRELKKIYDKDNSFLKGFKQYTQQQKELQRKKMGNTMSTHTVTDNNQTLDMNALLPGCVDIILEARKRILANEDEKVSISVLFVELSQLQNLKLSCPGAYVSHVPYPAFQVP